MGNKLQQHLCNCFSESKSPNSHQSNVPSENASTILKPLARKSGKVNQKNNEVASMISKLQNGERNVSLCDFMVERSIGRGAFGKVLLVKKDPITLNSQYFAMKIIRKKDIFKHKLAENIKLEKYILSKQKHPFIVDLKYAFQTSNKIYLIMEYIAGGELFKLLRKVKRFNEESAKFYLSEVLLAIEFLHKKMHVIYRDIKPENILLTEKGHVKITDFGLSKKTEEKAYTMVGTIEYLAPEVLTKAGHTSAVDFWGMGILLYEMLAGYPPFTAPNRNFEEIEKLILENKPFFPDYFSKEAIDLIKKLMNSDSEKRLGVHAINDIKNHCFFKGVHWSNVLNLKITPPYIIKNNVVNSLNVVDKNNLKEIKETLCSSKNLPNLAGITYNYDQLNSSLFTNNESPMRQSDFQKNN